MRGASRGRSGRFSGAQARRFSGAQASTMPRQNHPMPFSPQIDMKTMVPPRRWSTIEDETLICGELFRLWKVDRQLIKTYQISLALRGINDILSSFHLPFGLAFICVLRMFRKKDDMINMHAPILATNNGLHDARAGRHRIQHHNRNNWKAVRGYNN